MMTKRFSATDLADRVPVPAVLVKLQRELDELRDERDAAVLELEAIHAAVPLGFTARGPLHDARVAAERRLAELNGEISAKRKTFAEARVRHLAEIRKFVAPQLNEQKDCVAAAFGDFLAEVSALDLMHQAGRETVRNRPAALQIGLMARHALSALIGEPLVDRVLKAHAPPMRGAK